MTKREWLLKHDYCQDGMVHDVFKKKVPNLEHSYNIIGIALCEKSKLEPYYFVVFDYANLNVLNKKEYLEIGECFKQVESDFEQMIKECEDV